MRKSVACLFAVLSMFLLQTDGFAEQTKIIVRVKAKDAKFIGTSMGGARVVIRDSDTGAILAQGLTTGGTGNTDRIMRLPWQRRVWLSDEKTAKFETTLDIPEPTLVTIEATGPRSQRQAAITSSTQIWLIPGKPVDGDGVILELAGFAVDLLSPQNSAGFKRADGTLKLSVRANVVMMCGCPVTSGGLWNADEYDVAALVKQNGKLVQTVTLTITDTANTFAGNLTVTESGSYEIIVYAYDAQTGNTGVDAVTFYVR